MLLYLTTSFYELGLIKDPISKYYICIIISKLCATERLSPATQILIKFLENSGTCLQTELKGFVFYLIRNTGIMTIIFPLIIN